MGFYNNGLPLTSIVTGRACMDLSQEQVIQNRALREQARKESAARRMQEIVVHEMMQQAQKGERAKQKKADKEAAARWRAEEKIADKFYAKIKDLNVVSGQKTCKVTWHSTSETLDITYTAYRAPNFSFEDLVVVSEAVGTRKINIHSGVSEDGCPSCGHGAEWAFTLVCKNPTIPD